MSRRRFTAGDAPATTEQDLADFEESVPAWSPAGAPALVVIAPHPDDEVLGAGALIGAALREGIPVTVVAVTDGTASHPPDVIDPEMLGRVRTEESLSALEVLRELAPEARLDRVRLDLPDGEVAAYEEELVDELVWLLEQSAPGTLLAAPLRSDGHPDHEACGRAAVSAAAAVPTAQVLEFPIWLWHHTQPPAATDTATSSARGLIVDEELHRLRQQAVDQFRSQTTLDWGPPASGPHPVVPEAALGLMLRKRQIVWLGTTGFDALYDASADPWGLAERWYEERKYALTLAVLPKRRYRRAYEPGCSIGVLTGLLAQRCDAVVASDVVDSALADARERVPDAHVEFIRASVEDPPPGEFDLIVVSELAYYLSGPQFAALLAHAARSLSEDGVVLVAHWRHPIPGAYRSARSVHAAFAQHPGWQRLAIYEDEDVLIETFGPPRLSLAAEEFGTSPDTCSTT